MQEVRRRGLKVAVAGIPKTIDNDIPVIHCSMLQQYYGEITYFLCSPDSTAALFQVIDKSFGFDSAVEEAPRAVNAAHVEAGSAENGIGLVKLMGRYSGKFIIDNHYQLLYLQWLIQ